MSLLNNTEHIRDTRVRFVSLDMIGNLSLDSSIFVFANILIGSSLVAILAQISIPLPFSPVPITGQTVGVLLVGSLLGSRVGAFSICAYLLEGALGLPVFSGFKSGLIVFTGPTVGYLFGFIPAAFLMGWAVERGITSSLAGSLIFCTLASLLILCVGTLYFLIFQINITDAILLGFYPFLFGDLVKSAMVALVLAGIGRKL